MCVCVCGGGGRGGVGGWRVRSSVCTTFFAKKAESHP